MKNLIKGMCVILAAEILVFGPALIVHAADETPPAQAPQVNMEEVDLALTALDNVCASAVLVKIGSEPTRGLNRAEQSEIQRAGILVRGALAELRQLREEKTNAEKAVEAKANDETQGQ